MEKGREDRKTHREKDVHHIHQDEHQVGHPGEMQGIRGGNQHDRHQVVGEHLPVVLATGLDVQDEDLLQPERPLAQDVDLGEAREVARGPVGEHLAEVEVVLGGAVDVLVGDS